jgi:hypothetical protein
VKIQTISSLTHEGRGVVAVSQPASSALTLNPTQLLVETETSVRLIDEDTTVSAEEAGSDHAVDHARSEHSENESDVNLARFPD